MIRLLSVHQLSCWEKNDTVSLVYSENVGCLCLLVCQTVACWGVWRGDGSRWRLARQTESRLSGCNEYKWAPGLSPLIWSRSERSSRGTAMCNGLFSSVHSLNTQTLGFMLTVHKPSQTYVSVTLLCGYLYAYYVYWLSVVKVIVPSVVYTVNLIFNYP